MNQVRVRYAPSPTGAPHIGNIRTALFNWLYARHCGGSFILRIEDTDRGRLVEGALEAIMEGLQWLGLEYDEGPGKLGAYGPYYQSERLPIYQEQAQRLIDSGHAYRCYCKRERLEQVRAEQVKAKAPLVYDRHCRELTAAQRAEKEASGAPFVIRFATPLEGQTVVKDHLRGEIVFENANLDDHVLIKSDGWPTYQLANVVDDHLMAISHVMRGDEWISSAPKHVLEYEAFGWQAPVLVHLPLILGKDRTKLSKRHGATDVRAYRERGYLAEALVNFMALLGWSPPPESGETSDILRRPRLVELFDIDRIGVTPAVFDVDKLDWMNGAYIRLLPEAELAEAAVPYLRQDGLVSPELDEAAAVRLVEPLAPLFRERIKTLADTGDIVDFLLGNPHEYEARALLIKGASAETVRNSLLEVVTTLRRTEFEAAALEAALRRLAADSGLKTGQLFGAIRTAISGKTATPPLFESLAVLGRERAIERLQAAIDRLS